MIVHHQILSLDLRSYPTDDDSRINKATSLNPLGRDIIDRNKNKGKSKPINLKKDYTVSVLNAQTIRRKSKQEKLMQLFSKNRNNILGIVDHKIIQDDPIENHEKQNVTFITTSTTTNANNAPIRGLRLLINGTSSAALAEIKPYNSLILAAHFNGHPATTVIVHYAPVEGTPEAIDHYEHLSDITRTVPKHNVLLVIGDCNTHLCPKNETYTFHDRTIKMENFFLTIP